MISQVSPLGGCCELETHPDHDVPSTLLLHENLFIHNSPLYDICLQNVQTFDRCATRIPKGAVKKTDAED